MLWLLASGAMIIVAVWSDVRTMRIPNWCVLSGAFSALLIASMPGGLGLADALIGGAVGLALLLPLYIFRILGAGDVKLIAALGMFTGMPGIFGLTLATFASGGVLSLLWMIRHRQSANVLSNLRTGLLHGVMDASAGKLPSAQNFPVSQSRMPYACAIAAGMVLYVLLSKRF
ncbi:MAG TPA: prepilin peptidase [Aquabacterium sp.]|nr:prepilin peptidase [Aquabacterium sp.]